MTLLEKIQKDCSIQVHGQVYTVKGKAMYVTVKNPDAEYAKILLNDHNVLVLSPSDGVAYIGKNMGRLPEFDNFPELVCFNGVQYNQVADDYQIVTQIVFGSPLDVEGEVQYWDYESGTSIISTAITSRKKDRADVVGQYISFEEIEVL